MHRAFPVGLFLKTYGPNSQGSRARAFSADRLMGHWRAAVGAYDFAPTEAVITIARTGERKVLQIRSIEVEASKIVVTWVEDGAGSRTSFGKFTGNSMTQLSQRLDDGTMSLEHVFERCL